MTLQLVIQGEVRNTFRVAVRFEIGRWTGAPEAYTHSFSNVSFLAWNQAQNSEQIVRIQTGVWHVFFCHFWACTIYQPPTFFIGNFWLVIFKSKSRRKAIWFHLPSQPQDFETHSVFWWIVFIEIVHYDFYCLNAIWQSVFACVKSFQWRFTLNLRHPLDAEVWDFPSRLRMFLGWEVLHLWGCYPFGSGSSPTKNANKFS